MVNGLGDDLSLRGGGFQRVMVVNIAVGGRSDRVPFPQKKNLFSSQKQSYLFLRVIGLLLVWCLGGRGERTFKKGVLAINEKKTVLLVFYVLMHVR